jgi:hypothetical protein
MARAVIVLKGRITRIPVIRGIDCAEFKSAARTARIAVSLLRDPVIKADPIAIVSPAFRTEIEICTYVPETLCFR